MRDHCHFTGKYRGAAHYKCKKLKFTPVIFHNLANYDSHLLMDNLVKTEGNIKCFSNNEEKYISFSKERFIFNGIEKLIPNLSDKERYRAHHKTLKQYLNLGLRIKKIHRGISFEEEPWLGSYSEFHTKLRANAKNDFEKDFSKLMNNLSSEKTWKMTERKH